MKKDRLKRSTGKENAMFVLYFLGDLFVFELHCNLITDYGLLKGIRSGQEAIFKDDVVLRVIPKSSVPIIL